MTLNETQENKFFDDNLLDALRYNTAFYRLGYFYRSNWRVLHIDGFEGSLHPLPVSRGQQIKFFDYPVNENV